MKKNPDDPFFYPVILISGVLYPDEARWRWVEEKLSAMWGAPLDISEEFPFTSTDYYRDISPSLKRRFMSFPGLRDGGLLPDWKLEACCVERESRPSVRAVNIDPGYVDGARLVLASTKDHAHRIYLGKGIHGEVTMRYRFRKWEPFDYTFPDFAGGLYNSFLSAARERWKKEMEYRRNAL